MSAILSSGVASARKSSTPASLAMAAAVRGLSPVIITVRIPILRRPSKRSAMPDFTMSFRWMTPKTRVLSATTSGVPPEVEIRSTMGSRPSGTWPPCSVTHRRTESVAPLRIASAAIWPTFSPVTMMTGVPQRARKSASTSIPVASGRL